MFSISRHYQKLLKQSLTASFVLSDNLKRPINRNHLFAVASCVRVVDFSKCLIACFDYFWRRVREQVESLKRRRNALRRRLSAWLFVVIYGFNRIHAPQLAEPFIEEFPICYKPVSSSVRNYERRRELFPLILKSHT